MTDPMALPTILTLDPEAQFEHDAWMDADVMRVLTDRLLEEGLIQAMSETEARLKAAYYVDMQPEDLALYEIECRVREWLMRGCTRGFQLRVTGGWPDICFVVLYQPNRASVRLQGQRIAFRGAPTEGQPRLLRASSPVPSTKFRA